MKQRVTWVHVLIIGTLTILIIGIINAVSGFSTRDAGQRLMSADSDLPSPHSKTIADYHQRVKRLVELTGSSPEEICDGTLKYHERLTGENAMGCFQFMSAMITFTRSAARQGQEYREWEDYEEAAGAFVDFVRTGAVPQ